LIWIVPKPKILPLNPLTPNAPCRGRTAPLTSKRGILCIYSTNIGTEYFTLRFFPSSKSSLFYNSNVFGSCIVHILYTECAKIKKKIIIPAPKVNTNNMKDRTKHLHSPVRVVTSRSRWSGHNTGVKLIKKIILKNGARNLPPHSP